MRNIIGTGGGRVTVTEGPEGGVFLREGNYCNLYMLSLMRKANEIM